jgi:hypothetical protein
MSIVRHRSTNSQKRLEFAASGEMGLGMAASAYDRLVEEVADSPELLGYLETHFSEPGGGLAVRLIDAADESPFPLRQWLEALLVFDQWLDARGLRLPIEPQIGYVACSAEAGCAYPTLTQLPFQVGEMLEHYGCDEAIPW